MRIEKLNSMAILQRDHTQPGPSGRAAGQAWANPADVARVWCHVQNRTGREIPGQIAQSTGQYDVTIRTRPVDNKMRLMVDGRVLYITHVPIQAASEFITLLCEEMQ